VHVCQGGGDAGGEGGNGPLLVLLLCLAHDGGGEVPTGSFCCVMLCEWCVVLAQSCVMPLRCCVVLSEKGYPVGVKR
jgi:hypothetical protein